MNKEYYRAIAAVLFESVESAPRGMRVLELPHPYVFRLGSQYKNVLSILKPFHTRIDYAEAELRWYLSGSTRIDELVGPSGKSYARLWERFTDDGVNVNSAYGRYIFSDRFLGIFDGGEFPWMMSQWEWAREKLRYDSDTRQAVININQPHHKETPTRDFPCCVCMMFTIRGDMLNLTTVFRSQDVDTGLRNDVYTMHALQAKMAEELKIFPGTFTNVALNLHLYESKWDKAIEVIKNWKGQYGQDESR